jgi:hypothetical protein
VFILIYLGLGLLIAFLGRRRGLSFLPVFLLSIVLTPLIGLLFLLVAQGAQHQQPLAVAVAPTAVVCSDCAEHQMKVAARQRCSHCGLDL